jgi:hypothetical protein
MRALMMSFAAPSVAAFVALSAPAFGAQSEIEMAGAASGSFASKAEAEAFLARAVPAATAANPKYRSPNSDLETRWLSKTISFLQSDSRGVIVSTEEEIDEYRNGALSSKGTHQATFAIDEVNVSLETSPQDRTETGEQAQGVMFKCVGAPCIEAVWNGKQSISAWTDIYLNDADERKRIFEAFRTLQSKNDAH